MLVYLTKKTVGVRSKLRLLGLRWDNIGLEWGALYCFCRRCRRPYLCHWISGVLVFWPRSWKMYFLPWPSFKVPCLSLGSVSWLSTLTVHLQRQLLLSFAGGRVISGVCDFVCVCLCVRALKGKWLELPTPNSVRVYSMAGPQHTLTGRSIGQRSRSHGYENHHGEVCCCGRVHCTCCFWHGTARRMTA